MPPVQQPQESCPICSSPIEEYLINLETRMSMCENVKCTYPFDTSNPGKFMVKAVGMISHNNSSNGVSGGSSGDGPLKGKKRAMPLLDQPHKSVNGKKQEITYSSTSPIKQKDTPLVLALPSKTISTGSVLTTSPRTPSGASHFTQDPNPPKRYRSQATMASSQDSRSSPSPTTPVTTNPSSKDNNNSISSNYTLADIESLLNDGGDEDNGSTVVTPKEDSLGSMNPMVWLDDMFQGQNPTDDSLKCNPLQTDQDLDSLLGLSLFQ
ncbi:hypothetical protein [Absidia glauca]|uniref:Uncharacterized protein n=1 Tax=Absidia glauca TaxID=4829 RepID=A0A168QL52_ABSGL|nr:hypothetical protein [Absidia glauca]